MNALLKLYSGIFDPIGKLAGEWFLPTLARFSFAAVLLFYFWNSAGTKLGDGLFGIFKPGLNGYAQIFPKKMEAVGYDPSQLGLFEWAVVFSGTVAEYILPLLIIIGLFTKLASLGMIFFVLVQSYVDVNGHGVAGKDLGGWFDGPSGSLIMDQRLLWITVLLILLIKGAGPFALDRFVFRPAKTF